MVSKMNLEPTHLINIENQFVSWMLIWISLELNFWPSSNFQKQSAILYLAPIIQHPRSCFKSVSNSNSKISLHNIFLKGDL
jgi:hypothetical protein